MASFRSLIKLIRDGQEVDESTINRVLSELDSNTKYVKELIEAAVMGEAVYARCVTVESSAAVGMPVYYNATSKKFCRALAATQSDTSGNIFASASSHVWGVVSQKHNATSADILLSGYAPLNLTSAVSGTVSAGVYYLSGTVPGGLTLQKPPVSVVVLNADGAGNVNVRPTIYEPLEQHKHYKFELVCAPAGAANTPGIGSRHEIVSSDVDEEGWLPADHAIFDGNAPLGAMFGYNLSASGLKNLWPPIPASSAYLEWYKDVSRDYGGTGVPLGPAGLAVIDTHGIWWMSDCYGDVPWTTSPFDSSDVSTTECPRELEMRLTLWMTKMTFQTSNSVVTSLRSSPGSHITVTCVSDGAAATTGDLELSLDLDFVEGSTDTEGHIVFKELNVYPPIDFTVVAGGTTLTLAGDHTAEFTSGDALVVKPTTPTPTCESCVKTIQLTAAPALISGNTLLSLENSIDSLTTAGTVYSGTRAAQKEFKLGPVVEGILSGSSNVTVTSTHPAGNLQQGVVTISVDDSVDGKELQTQIIRLSGVTESFYRDVIGLALDADVVSSFRSQINVPFSGIASGTKVKLRFRILNRGSNGASVPALNLTYRRIPAASTAQNLPISDTSLTLSSGLTFNTDQYLDVDSNDFLVAAGDTVLFTLERVAAGGVDIQILRQTALLVA